MAVNVVLNGVTYSIPEPGNDAWGQSLTDYFVAQASGLLQKAGGTFSLTAEVDFGTTYGLKSAYFKSRAASPATSGQVRLGNAEGVYWRNAAGSANLGLLVNASDQLEFNGTTIQPSGNYITSLTGAVTATGPGAAATTISAGAIVNSMISASAAIAYSKLSLTGSIVNADISASAAIAYSKLNLAGSVANSDLASMAANTIKGNNTGSSAAPSNLTGSQVTALLSNFVGDSGSGGTKGLVPAPAAGDAAAAKFLKADGTWTAPAGSGTVTSVQVAGANGLSFSGGPITGSGTITASLTVPKVTTYTSGSGTFTKTGSPLYIRVRMVGGGGGGSGSGTASWGAPGDGGNTTFGSSLLTANGGKGASYGFSVGQGGTGGTASLGTGPVGTALSGATGSGGPLVQTGTTQVAGAPGASSPFGGAGAAGSAGGGASGAGGAAVTNSGSGGGGAGSPNVSGVVVSGFGGGAGGYIDAIISSPSSTYSYAVGASGTAGTAGTSGYAGGAGGSGYIEVTEYYQ